ncbi:MAG: hypothetical protein [Microvirus sp.]|nr:MAG: hypothetical protein [Microvirus sp.]
MLLSFKIHLQVLSLLITIKWLVLLMFNVRLNKPILIGYLAKSKLVLLLLYRMYVPWFLRCILIMLKLKTLMLWLRLIMLKKLVCVLIISCKILFLICLLVWLKISILKVMLNKTNGVVVLTFLYLSMLLPLLLRSLHLLLNLVGKQKNIRNNNIIFYYTLL